MSIISLSHVSYSLSTRELFRDLTLAINAGERTALVGLNGAGKSTLLKLITGDIEPDSGVVARRHGAVIEYVPQTLPSELREKTLAEALAEQLPEEMRWDGFEYMIEQHLCAAGFSPDRHTQPLGTLSGGEVNRALLARALIVEPDLVLLDEPTNHMDIEQVAAFEKFLNEELVAAALIVSHDRELLDTTTSTTLFLREGAIQRFDLPFSRARVALAEADEAAFRRRQSEEREISRLRESASRLAEWGRVYSNEKFSYRAQSIQKRVEKLQKQVTSVPKTHRAEVSLEFEASSSSHLVDIRGLTLHTPGGHHLCTIEKLAVRRGERLAVLGRNGCGKSTLMKALVHQWSNGVRSANISFNPSTTLGYYDQELAHFRAGERISEAVSTRCNVSSHRVTQELIVAGFPYERHRERVDSLSGGERARLTFMILKLQRPHLLMLDEPTNHLDISGIEQLEQSLIEGGSTVIFVSHDRRFVEQVATRVFELSPTSS
jgi:ATP-binding cassette subfamily F protein 3